MSFLNPLYLIGALVASVPILLHLIRREHARKVEFPSLMFLRRISKKTIRYQKLRHLLLLLLRIMALLLIVLAFMRPFRESAGSAPVLGRVTTAHILLVDTSMSMGYQDRLQRAKKAAADIVRNAGAGDRFAVLAFSDRTEAVTQPTADSAEALAAIENSLEVTDQPTHYAQALRAGEKFALDAGTKKRIIHLISDFQKSGVAAQEQEFRLGAGIELQPVDLGSNDFSNIAIRDVHVVEADAGAPGSIIVKASPVNFGTRDRKNVRVSIAADGRKVAEKRIDLPMGASQGVEFQLPGLIAGVHQVVLEAEDADLTRDNRFYMTLEARGKTPVLAIENQEGRRARAPSFFLSNALNIDTLSPYKLTVASPQSAGITGGLLIWNNAPAGTAIQKKLQEFVKSGGGLAIVVSHSSQAAEFNRSFGSWLPVKAVSDSETGTSSRSAQDYVLMTDVRVDHPIFRPFGNPHSGNFASARFFRHAKLEVGVGTDVPARFDNGDPALVSLGYGSGRVVIFTSSADDDSNDLPLKAVYAPFWQQILRYLENFRERRHWLEIGETAGPRRLLTEFALLHSKANPDANQAVVVLDPQKRRVPLAPGSDQIAMDMAGFYEIRTMNFSNSIAVNTLPKESDLAHGNAEEMTSGWVSSQPSAFTQDARLSPEEQDRRQRTWSMLLIAAVLFLVSELLLSNNVLRVRNEEWKHADTVNR
jgi:hypothetical protein